MKLLMKKHPGQGYFSLMFLGVWDVPRSGTEPVFPALVGGFFTTEPPGKPLDFFLFFFLIFLLKYS